jgi:hypothetical protein
VGSFAAHAFDQRVNAPVDAIAESAEPMQPTGARLGFFTYQ